jgi:hypothetical protein
MSIGTLLNKARSNLVWLILPLSVNALSTELAPEIEAKIIVIPTLILMITLCILELNERWSILNRIIKKEFK